jgi:predicted porin
MEKSMKKNIIKLAVAGAVFAAASAAHAGIIIPAGEWTVDLSGNVNAYTTWAKAKGSAVIEGGAVGLPQAGGTKGSNNSFSNGLLPNFLSVTGTTRQNDLDVSFTISLQPGSTAYNALNGGTGGTGGMNNGNGGINNRQAFITFGDKSWGSVKIGKDLGIFASDAILSDMTLLGVGAPVAGGAGGNYGGNTTLGRIGYGYLYADWNPTIAYTTPNFSGFQATVGISQAFASNSFAYAGSGSTEDSAPVSTRGTLTNSGKNGNVAYEGKASYSFAANDVTGKVWVSGLAQHVGAMSLTETETVSQLNLFTDNGFTHSSIGTQSSVLANSDPLAYVGDIGANVNFGGFGLTGYYYSGQGVGITGQMNNGYGLNNTGGVSARDSDGGYVQATYTLPTKTKIGLSWGASNLDLAAGEVNANLISKNEMYVGMITHPLTKHLNLVAEYSHSKSENQASQRNTTDAGSLGAILFF